MIGPTRHLSKLYDRPLTPQPTQVFISEAREAMVMTIQLKYTPLLLEKKAKSPASSAVVSSYVSLRERLTFTTLS